MPDQFIRAEGVTEMYNVVREREIIGLVWRIVDMWHASANSMYNPGITEQTREAAAAKL